MSNPDTSIAGFGPGDRATGGKSFRVTGVGRSQESFDELDCGSSAVVPSATALEHLGSARNAGPPHHQALLGRDSRPHCLKTARMSRGPI